MGEIGQIKEVIDAILKGIDSPIKAGVGAILALFLYFFILVQKGQLRAKKAESEKNEQKGESNTDLENSNAEGEGSVRDKLKRRNTEQT